MKDSIIKNSLLQKILIYILSIFVLYLLVLLLSQKFVGEIILPNPNNIIVEFFNLLDNSDTYLCIGNTLKTLIISIIISFILGLSLGVLSGIFKYVRYFFKPWITIMRCMPLAAIIIIIILLVDAENTYYIVCDLVLIPIIYEGICNAIMDINKEYIDVYKLESNLNFKVIFKVYLPLILSSIRASFISAVGLGMKVVIMAEYVVVSEDCLGSKINIINIVFYDNETVYAYCIIIVIVVLLVELLPKVSYKLYNYIKFR